MKKIFSIKLFKRWKMLVQKKKSRREAFRCQEFRRQTISADYFNVRTFLREIISYWKTSILYSSRNIFGAIKLRCETISGREYFGVIYFLRCNISAWVTRIFGAKQKNYTQNQCDVKYFWLNEIPAWYRFEAKISRFKTISARDHFGVTPFWREDTFRCRIIWAQHCFWRKNISARDHIIF